jgi:Cytochrome bd terminal oxidase subunit I
MSVLAAALAPVQQEYLDEARQMQALSFAAHIPLVAFGISFPAMVLFVEWLYLRTGDPLYRTLARRWTRVMVALFAASRSSPRPSPQKTGRRGSTLVRHAGRADNAPRPTTHDPT